MFSKLYHKCEKDDIGRIVNDFLILTTPDGDLEFYDYKGIVIQDDTNREMCCLVGEPGLKFLKKMNLSHILNVRRFLKSIMELLENKQTLSIATEDS